MFGQVPSVSGGGVIAPADPDRQIVVTIVDSAGGALFGPNMAKCHKDGQDMKLQAVFSQLDVAGDMKPA